MNTVTKSTTTYGQLKSKQKQINFATDSNSTEANETRL